MKALRQLGLLKVNLRPETPADEDHRVLALFRNRAELKKAYGDLQEETFRLKDLIKQQEGATQRAHEMLSTLEERLGAAETAYPALVFYQLRRLWQSGRELITGFVADLARQQDERERRIFLAQYNRRQFARREAAETALQTAQAVQLEAGAQLAALQAERATLTRFWHYFRRRALDRRLDVAHGALASADATLRQAQAALEEVLLEAAPDFPGLSVNARRAINIAAIAYAEVLCQRLTELKMPLVEMAREATAQREPGAAYGNPKECVLLMGQIARANRLIADRNGLTEQIRVRGEALQQVARYRGAGDTVPVTDALDPAGRDILEQKPGAAATPPPNVLAEDTWDLFRILLR